MERRDDQRRARRLRVTFWEAGEEKHHPAFTTNISATGMFIATNHAIPCGARLRVQVYGPESSFIVETVTTRSVQVSPTLQSVKQQGIGVRFLTVKELVGEMIPELASGADPASEHDAQLPAGTYRLRFRSKEKFLVAFRRDISTGGLFLPTNQPAPLSQTITVQVEVASSGLAPLRLRARVVHVIDQAQIAGASNLIAGMGLELLDRTRALEQLRTWANSFR